MNWPARFASPMIGAVLLAATAAAVPPLSQSELADRIAILPSDKAIEHVELYTPAETVKGDPRPIPVAAKGDPGISAPALAAAIDYARDQGSDALLILRNGRLVSETYWNGYGPRSQFSTASMHKTVMALSYGAAIAKGLIAIGDRVDRYLPEWRGDPRGAIRIADLLHMASGLKLPEGAIRDARSQSARLMFDSDIRAAALAYARDKDPATEFAYNNANSQLAGMALVSATGERYATWLSRTIWRPIGAADATVWLDHRGGTPRFFCCFQATPRDWAKIGELIRLKGKVGTRQIVPADWIAAMAASSPLNPNYGMQLWRGSPYTPLRTYTPGATFGIPAAEPFVRDDVLFLDGTGAQRVYAIPSAGLTIVRIGKAAPHWDDSKLPNILLRGLE